MKLTDRLTVPSYVTVCRVADESVLLDTADGIYFGLDPVGTRIWQLLEEGKTLAEVCDVLLSEFDVSRERLELDLVNLAADLTERRLVVVSS